MPGTRMSKTFVQVNEVVGFAVLLLMVIAIVAGQADARSEDAPLRQAVHANTKLEDSWNIEFDGEIGAAALKISVDLVSDSSHFRGEDE